MPFINDRAFIYIYIYIYIYILHGRVCDPGFHAFRNHQTEFGFIVIAIEKEPSGSPQLLSVDFSVAITLWCWGGHYFFP